MSDQTPFGYAAQQVQSHDRERFVTVLFAPTDRRADLFSLYAFYGEVARIRASVHEAMAGLIRLQWWREVLSGRRAEEAARHPIAAPLMDCVARHGLSFALFDEILLCREQELSAPGFDDLQALGDFGSRCGGALICLALAVLGHGDGGLHSMARQIGRGTMQIGMARSLPHHLAMGWAPIPRSYGSVAPDAESLRRVAAQMVQAGLADLPRQAVPRSALPALLCAVQARSQGRRILKLGGNVLDVRVSLPQTCVPGQILSMIRGRI